MSEKSSARSKTQHLVFQSPSGETSELELTEKEMNDLLARAKKMGLSLEDYVNQSIELYIEELLKLQDIPPTGFTTEMLQQLGEDE